MGSMLPYIAAPWILWVILCFAKQFTQHVDSQPTNFSGPLMSIVFRGKVWGGSSHFLWYQWGTCNGILRAMAGMREDYICYPCIHSGLRSCLDMFSISTSIFWCTGCHDYPWSIAKSKADHLCDSGWFHPVGSGAVENFLRWDVQSFFFSSARCPEVGVSQYITCIPWEITIISMIIACNFPLPAIFDYCASDSLSNLEFLSVKPCERSDFVFAGSSVVHEIPTCHVCKIITTLKHPIMWYLQFKLSCCLYINPVRYG